MSLLASRIAVLGPADIDCRAYVNAVGANGGSVSLSRQSLLSRALFGPLKVAGTWALMDDAWLQVAENPVQGLISLKQLRLGTAVGSPWGSTWPVDLGITYDGATQYVDTGFIPQTHKVTMAQDSARIAIYSRANVTSTGYVFGCASSGNRQLSTRPRITTNCAANTNCTGGSFTLGVNDTRGYFAASRATPDATTNFGFKNGASIVRASDPTGYVSPGVGMPLVSLLMGALNNAGTPSNFSVGTLGFAAVGAPLSSAQELAEYNILQGYMTALGAQV